MDLRSAKPVTYRSFAGGMNEYYADYAMRDDEVRSCKNVEFRRPGRVDVRKGVGIYSDLAVVMNMPVKALHYYTRSDGSHTVLAMSGESPNGALFIDDDAGTFAKSSYIGAGLAGTDGFTRMVQYRDCIFMGDNAQGLVAYNPDIDSLGDIIKYTNSVITGDMLATYGPATTLAAVASSAGKPGLPDLVYYYRFTYEMYAGDTFLGETHPLFDMGGSTTRTGGEGQISKPIEIGKAAGNRDEGWEVIDKAYEELEVDLTGGANNDNKVDFQIQQPSFGATVDTYGTHYKYINIYRSGPYDAIRDVIGPAYTYPEDNPKDTESHGAFFLLGQIDVAAMYAQAGGTVAFTDDGRLALGKQIEYRPSRQPPSPRFLEVHKDRLWLAAVDEFVGLSYNTTEQMNRIYLSEANQPMVFPVWSWVDIAPRDGEALTGIKSFRDKVLIAFKQTSMWAITGGDDVIFGNIPQISREVISNNIGCVAPETITQAEGLLLWLSHRGPYMFDGSVPVPLKDRQIQETLRRIPDGRIYKSTAAYNAKEREWWLAVTDSDEDADHNTVVLKYHFESKAWSRHVFPHGVGAMLEKENSQLKPKFLVGLDDDTVYMGLTGAVVEADVNVIDTFNGSITDDIQWEIKTKKLDFGQPQTDKRLVAVQLEGITSTIVGLHIKCDERLDTSPISGFTTPAAINGKQLIHLDSRIYGRRFQLTLYGTVQAGDTTPYIEGITCYYQTKEGVLEGE